MKILLALACSLIFCGAVQADPAMRAKYGPDPESGFPQIVQASDYATIEFMESLCRHLADVSSDKEKPEQFGRAVDFEITADSLTFRSPHDAKRSVVVRRFDAQTITIQKARFIGGPTMALYSTLFRILTDFTGRDPCRGVRFVQYGTRAYRTRSIVEFDFGEKIVVVDSLSNGPKEEERLYLLDVVPRKDSVFWGRKGRVTFREPIEVSILN